MEIARVPAPLVERAPVTRLLGAGTAPPLTLVVAPAGTGKSTALGNWARQWARSPGARVGWVDCAAAAAAGLAWEAAALDALGGPRLSPPPTGTPLLQAVRKLHDGPLALVVDGVDRLDGPPRNALLRFAADVALERPPGVRLLLSARTELPLPLGVAPPSDGVTCLRGRHLAFTPADTKALLAAHGVTLSAQSLLLLIRRLGGWAYGVRVAAATLAERPDPSAAVPAFLTRDDADLSGYLAREFLGPLPAETRDVLLATCQADEVPARLAIELSGNPLAAHLLAQLARDGIFVSASGGPSPTYRYHPLLARALHRERDRAHPAMARDAHRRTAGRDAARGDHVSAAEHALEAGDVGLAVDTLAAHGPALVLAGRGPRLLELARRLPGGAGRRHPELLPVLAFAHLLDGTPAEGARLLRQATDLAGGVGRGRSGSFRVDLAILRLEFARRGADSAEAVLADSAGLLAEYDGWASRQAGRPPADRDATRAALLLQGAGAVEVLLGRLGRATRHLETARTLAQAGDQPALVSLCESHLAILWLLRSLPQHAAEAAQAALRTAGPGAEVTGGLARTHLTLCWTHFQAGALAESTAALRAAEAAMPAEEDPLLSPLLALLRAWLAGEQGRLPEARAGLETLLASGPAVPLQLEVMMRCTTACYALAAGDLTTARRETVALATAEVGEAVLTGAMLAAAVDGPAAARQRIAALLDGRTAPVFQISTVAGWMLESLWCQAVEPAASLPAMARAVELAAPHRFRQVFVSAGPAVLELVEKVSSSTGQPTVPLPRAGSEFDRGASPLPSEPSPSVPEPLSDREREVLALLPVAMSYDEMAKALFVSRNTVKTHVRAIYRKLGARRRSEAVRIARAAGLL